MCITVIVACIGTIRLDIDLFSVACLTKDVEISVSQPFLRFDTSMCLDNGDKGSVL